MSQPNDRPTPLGVVSYLPAGAVPPASNPLGIAGFVLSMVGLVGLCFAPALLLGLLGTILCAVAVRREPRGLAIAGLIVGAIEVIFGALLLVFLGIVLGTAAVGVNAAAKVAQTTQAGANLRQVIESQRDQTGTLPASLASIPGLTATSDAWGHAIRYVPNSPTNGEFDLVSDGPDGTPGTADDLHLSPGDAAVPTTEP